MSLSAPEPLAAHHDTVAFACGIESLDQATGASRTFVVCDGKRVVAYYPLASSAIFDPIQ